MGEMADLYNEMWADDEEWEYDYSLRSKRTRPVEVWSGMRMIVKIRMPVGRR